MPLIGLFIIVILLLKGVQNGENGNTIKIYYITNGTEKLELHNIVDKLNYMEISVLIKTIGRITLQSSINSAKREGFNEIIVVSDGFNVDVIGAKIISLPKKWGSYGSVAANVGVGFCTKPYILILDDDDELKKGSGDIIRNTIIKNPDIDIWIPGLLFNNGLKLCDGSNRKIQHGNIAVPIYKTEVLTSVPFKSKIHSKNRYNIKNLWINKLISIFSKKSKINQINFIDFSQVYEAYKLGYKIDWIGKIVYLVRPNSDDLNGRGL